MSKSEHKKSACYFPSDWALLIPPFAILVLVTVLAPPLLSARAGDATLAYVAIAIAVLGIALLLLARRPLYRQRRRFALGPRQ